MAGLLPSRVMTGEERFPLVEAAAELALASLMTRFREARYFTFFRLRRRDTDAGLPPLDADRRFAAQCVGHAVAVMAERVPFRAVCLQQSIATQRMLRRRGIEAEIRFGVRLDAGRLGRPSDPDAAHAWVVAGGLVVNGLIEGLDSFAVAGRFA